MWLLGTGTICWLLLLCCPASAIDSSANQPLLNVGERNVGLSLTAADVDKQPNEQSPGENGPFDDYFVEHQQPAEEVKLRRDQEEEEGQEAEVSAGEVLEEAVHVHRFIKNNTGPHPNQWQANSSAIAQSSHLETDSLNMLATSQNPVSAFTMVEPITTAAIAAIAADDESREEVLGQQQLCSASVHVPTFLRHQWLAFGQQGQGMLAANFVRKMDSLEACARLCRENVEPFGGRHFGCHGFTYFGKKSAKSNICEFFDDHLAAAIEKKPPLGGVSTDNKVANAADAMPSSSASAKNYFERICLPLSSRCSRFPFAFEVYPRRSFAGAQPLQSEEVDDRKRCLELCLQNEKCRSVDFDTTNATCRLYTQTQHWTLGASLETNSVEKIVEAADSDHYENTCLLSLDRCGSRHLAFVLARNSELSGFTVGLGKLSISACLAHCLDSPPAFCRSVQFRPASEECFLGTERPLEPLPSDELDIFEPICLPDPPVTSTLECLDEAVFERVPNMELRMEQAATTTSQPTESESIAGTDIVGVPLEECLDACILDETCHGFNYRFPDIQMPAQCQLLSFNRADNRTLPVLIQNVDYYELACNRIIQGSHNKTAEPRGHKKGNAKQKKLLTTTTTTIFSSKTTTSTTINKNIANSTDTTITTTSSNSNTTLTSVVASIAKQQQAAMASFQLQQETAATTSSQPTSSHSPSCMMSNGTSNNSVAVLLERGVILAPAERQQHVVNVRSVDQCLRLCQLAKAFHCATFAYGRKSRDCLLSSSVLLGKAGAENAKLVGQKNPNYDLYAVGPEESDGACSPSGLLESSPLEEVVNIPSEGGQIVPAAGEAPNSNVVQESQDNPSPGTSPSAEMHSSTLQSHGPSDTLTSSAGGLESTAPAATVAASTARPPDAPPLSRKPAAPLSAHQVHVSALCDPQGVNVTFRILNARYNGVVYAADRFRQCRLFVDDEAQFHFYVGRPAGEQPNWCNVHRQEMEGGRQLISFLLVLSNDLGLPPELTTKEDLFFYISCNYAASAVEQTHNGIVVSGLGIGAAELGKLRQDIQQMERREGGDKRVKLKILRDQMPVKSVFIGERLVAVIESNLLGAGTFRVADCNATAAGLASSLGQSNKVVDASAAAGIGAGAGTIPLLDRRGCPLLPQIMGPWRWVRGQLQASLTAFRIAGSPEVDIICSVIICRSSCLQQQSTQICADDPSRVGRMAFGQTSPAGMIDLPEEEGDKITVDQRIRVLVLNEEEATGLESNADKKFPAHVDLADTIAQSEAGSGRILEAATNPVDNILKPSAAGDPKGEVCLNPLVLLLLAMLLVLAVALLLVLLLNQWCRRKTSRTNFYPTSTELSSHHFHIPRILDHRGYMA